MSGILAALTPSNAVTRRIITLISAVLGLALGLSITLAATSSGSHSVDSAHSAHGAINANSGLMVAMADVVSAARNLHVSTPNPWQVTPVGYHRCPKNESFCAEFPGTKGDTQTESDQSFTSVSGWAHGYVATIGWTLYWVEVIHSIYANPKTAITALNGGMPHPQWVKIDDNVGAFFPTDAYNGPALVIYDHANHTVYYAQVASPGLATISPNDPDAIAFLYSLYNVPILY